MMRPLQVSFESVSAREPLIELRVECAEDFDIASPFSIPRLVNSFITLGRYGGFAGPKYPPESSSVRVRSKEMIDNVGRWVIESVSCHPGAATVLYNFVTFSHMHVAALKHAQVRSSISPMSGLPTPPLSYHRPLPFAADVAVDSDEVAVCVQFASLPDELNARGIEDLLKSWLYITAAAGFIEDPMSASRPLAIPEEDPEWIADEVWLRLVDAEIEESAFDPLVSALQAVHARIAAIKKVQIE